MERKVIEHEVISNDYDMEIDEKVKEYLDDGWEIYGSACVTYDSKNDNFEYFQTMVKYA